MSIGTMILATANVPLFVRYHEMTCDTQVVPFDLIEATVQIEGSVQLFGPGGLPFYEATGTTDVKWDTQTTIGVNCPRCGDTGIVPEWARQCGPIAELGRWLVNSVDGAQYAAWR